MHKQRFQPCLILGKTKGILSGITQSLEQHKEQYKIIDQPQQLAKEVCRNDNHFTILNIKNLSGDTLYHLQCALKQCRRPKLIITLECTEESEGLSRVLHGALLILRWREEKEVFPLVLKKMLSGKKVSTRVFPRKKKSDLIQINMDLQKPCLGQLIDISQSGARIMVGCCKFRQGKYLKLFYRNKSKGYFARVEWTRKDQDGVIAGLSFVAQI